ncbi:MAG: hypothetical protein ACRYFU_10240 [Janthinobacterium lividum]
MNLRDARETIFALQKQRRIPRNEFKTLKQRNQQFAARQTEQGTLMPSLSDALPHVRAMVIGCADMRVDPVHILGIEPGRPS